MLRLLQSLVTEIADDLEAELALQNDYEQFTRDLDEHARDAATAASSVELDETQKRRDTFEHLAKHIRNNLAAKWKQINEEIVKPRRHVEVGVNLDDAKAKYDALLEDLVQKQTILVRLQIVIVLLVIVSCRIAPAHWLRS